jgi:hypothetical protein
MHKTRLACTASGICFPFFPLIVGYVLVRAPT